MKAAIILCAGEGRRAELGYNKILFPLDGKSVLETVLEKFVHFDRIVVVSAQNDIETIKSICETFKENNRINTEILVTAGGETRTDSVKRGLNGLRILEKSLSLFNSQQGSSALEKLDNAIVAIHDAARPFVDDEVITTAILSAERYGSGIPVIECIDTIKVISDGVIIDSPPRENMRVVQTPQCFIYKDIAAAYELIADSYTDDSEVYLLAGNFPFITQGSPKNKKLTTPHDFAELANKTEAADYVGHGFDVHKLEAGRRLILGGIEIPFEKGLLGHSDADVLLHAVMDAVLSAAGLSDIGVLFPDSDINYKDADSAELLKICSEKLAALNFYIKSVSAVLIAQKPKLSGYIPSMRVKISSILNTGIDKINISATTTEFLGIIGEGQAIAASAVCLIGKINNYKI